MFSYGLISTSLYLELVVAPDGEKDLSDPDPGRGAVSLAVSSPHSSLEPGNADLKIGFLILANGSREAKVFSGVNCHKSWLS